MPQSDKYDKAIVLYFGQLSAASAAPIIVEAVNLATQGETATWKMELGGKQIKVAFADEEHLANFERVFSGVRLGLSVANNPDCVPCSTPMDAYLVDIRTHRVSDTPPSRSTGIPIPPRTTPRGMVKATDQD